MLPPFIISAVDFSTQQPILLGAGVNTLDERSYFVVDFVVCASRRGFNLISIIVPQIPTTIFFPGRAKSLFFLG